jgi:two-component system sensor histidine kinase/response regulator
LVSATEGEKFGKLIKKDSTSENQASTMKLLEVPISNAIKFTENGGVCITVRQDESFFRETSERIGLIFSVKDTGIGLNSEQIKAAFDSFSQGDGSTTRKYGGTGLGLAIVKSLVELMGGQVNVTSFPGRETTFYFTAIFAKSHGDPEISSSVLLHKRRVLLVDDDTSDLEFLANLMQASRMDVRTVQSGAEALELLKTATELKTPFELLLIDWRMSRMDGVETVRHIRQNEKEIAPPHILMMSAYDRQECLRHVQGLNVADVLVKPIQPERFKNILKTVFREDLSRKTSEERADLRGTKILLAEDNKINQMVASELLRMLEVDVTVVSNGIEAIDAVKAATFDLILMDIQMPAMDGLVATQMIRNLAKPEVGRLPILAMTANATDLDYQKSLDVGMNDHLTKPIDPEKLRLALEKWIVR